MTQAGLEPFAAGALPESLDPAAASAAAYATEVVELLSGLLLELVRLRQPDIEPVLRGEGDVGSLNPDVVARALQVQGIWFQLLSIAEQNAAMRRRRQIEAERGHDQLRGTFENVISSAAASGIKADDIRALLDQLRVRPVITAHPTEAKRVTVLEKHRRIYRRLVDLESPRWTPRERQALVAGLRNDIELLWLTGELRLAKPTVPQEVYWGLHYFNETLFEAVPDLMDEGRAGAGGVLPGRSLPGAGLLPVRLLGRRRQGRQSVRHQRRHPQHVAGEPADRGSALPPAAGGAGARAEHHRARDHGVGSVPTGARAGARRYRRG